MLILKTLALEPMHDSETREWGREVAAIARILEKS
jgi:hypothetical protein